MKNPFFNDKFTGTALKKVVLKFFPPQFIKNVNLSELGFDTPEILPDNGVKLLHKLMKHATDDIRMFGTADQIASDLCLYRSFPSNHKFFGIDITEEYNYDIRVYQNRHGNTFICKQDFLVKLQDSLRFALPDVYNLPIVRSVISIFLKTCEVKLNRCCEFIRFNIDTFGNIGKLENPVDFKRFTIHCLPSSSTFVEIFNEWKGWIPGWTDEQYEPIRKALRAYFKGSPKSKNDDSYKTVASYFQYLLDLLQNHLESHPEYFLPATHETIKMCPMAVRVFPMDDNRIVVMRSELFKAFKFISGDSNEWNYKDPDGFLQTMNFDNVKKHYGDLVSKIEFIYQMSREEGSRPTPIMTPTGGYCVHFSEAYQQITTCLTMVLKVFQKVKKDSWHLVEEYMEWLEKELKISGVVAEFITVDKLNYILKNTHDFFKECENVPVKSIRNVRKTGFTLDDLKAELKMSGLMDVFPDILGSSKQAYDITVSRKNGNFLCTSDMFSAFSLCQTSCMVNMFREVFLTANALDVDKSVEEADKCITESDTGSSEDDDWEDEKDLVIDDLRSKMKKFIESNVGLHETCKKNEKEIGDLREKTASLMNSLKGYEHLKSKLSKCEKRESTSKEQNKKLNESNQQLTRLVATLKSQLKNEQQKLKKVEEDFEQKEADFDKQKDIMKTNFAGCSEALAAIEKKYKIITAEVDRLADSDSGFKKRITDLESRHSKDILEIKKLKQKGANYREQIEKLQLDISTKNTEFEKKITESEQIILGLTDSRNQMIERNEKFESLLEKEKQRTQELAQTMVPSLQRMANGQLDVDLEQDFFEKTRSINQLQEENSRLTGQLEKQEMTLKAVLHHFGPVQISYSSSSCQTTPEEFTSGYTGVKHHLWSLQKIKDSFRNGKQLKQAKEMVEKLSTQQLEIQEMATYELQQYEAQLHHYLQSIEVNIQKIKKTGECTQLDPIPDLPTFSDRFLNEYWKLIDNKNSVSEISEKTEEDDATDSECLICLIEMAPEEKTMKCEHCRKVLHMECASEWLKRHRSCPHCRRELLDPNEFPPLS